MRRALGLDGRPTAARSAGPRPSEPHGPARHRHRFVSDGDVPVVVVNSRPDQPSANRLDAAAAALTEERSARERTERALAAALARIRDMETKLVHVSIARDEAVAALEQAQGQLAAALAATPPAQPAESPPAGQPVVRRRGRPPKAKGERPPAKPRTRTPKPVKWWIKGWRDAAAE